MSTWQAPAGDGHTPLSPDDREGLLQSHIATRDDLNDAEQRNIAKALRRRAPTVDMLLDDKYLRDLHAAMFGEVWSWAGRYRQRETNIGVSPAQIAPTLRLLTQDAKAWVEFRSFEPDELAVRMHHRLVQIHPFPNGNGRHSRMCADFLVEVLGRDPFSWGSQSFPEIDKLRGAYLMALRVADGGDVSELLSFARR